MYVGRARVIFFPITVQFTTFCNVILLFTLLYSPSVYINTDNHKRSLLVVLYIGIFLLPSITFGQTKACVFKQG